MISLLKKNASHSFSLPNSDATLWVASFDDKDPWYNFLNWQTQFELTRFSKQKDNGKNFPLLYFCGKFLPAKMLLLLKADNPADWALTLEKKWQDLGKVKTQVFLPASMTRLDFEKTWKPEESQVSFIEEAP